MINEKDIAEACNNAGINTPELLAAFFTKGATQNRIRELDIALDDLSKQRADAVKPIEDKRIDLTNQRAALVDQLREAGG